MKKKRDTRNAIMRTEMETRFPSLSRAPFTNKDPIPGRAKIFSTTAAPPKPTLRESDTREKRTGRDGRKADRTTSFLSFIPLARAVRV